MSLFFHIKFKPTSYTSFLPVRRKHKHNLLNNLSYKKNEKTEITPSNISTDLIISVIYGETEDLGQNFEYDSYLEPPDTSNYTLKESSIIAASQDKKICSLFAESLVKWSSQIEKFFFVFEKVQQKDEENDLSDEINYWGEKNSAFSSIITSLKTERIKIVFYVLRAIKHPQISIWNDLEMKIHEAAIEAEYNLKYLSPFENFTEIFDDFEPQKVTRILPVFFSKVYKVHRILAYY